MTAPELPPVAGTAPPGPEEFSVPSVDFEVPELLSHLLRRAHFHAEARFAPIYEELDVTSRQLALLFTLNRMPGASQAELAEAIGIDVNTFSDLAQRSERKGLLRRVRSEGDQRAFRLYLTSLGCRLIIQATDITPVYQRDIADRLTPKEVERLVALLRKMLGLSRTPPR